jgi:hypothetical protein
MRRRARPLLRDVRRTPAWPLLATCVLVIAGLGVLLHDPTRRTGTRMARAALVVAACAVTALVVVGVIGLRWHYFTDTVGGVALGTGTVLALALLIDLAPGPLRSRASALLSRRRPTSRYRSAPAGRRAPARESRPGAGHAATGTPGAPLPRLHRPARQHVRP